MAVGYRSASSTGVSDNLVSSINVPVPSGAASGDVALVALGMWEIGNPTVTAPSGFTLLTTVLSGSQKLKIFWKRLTGADTGNYTFSWSGSQWTIGHAALFTGVLASGDPIGSNFNSATAASGTTIPSTSVTVAGAHGLAHFVANENSATHTPPTNFTEVGESNYLASNYRLPGASGTYTASGGTLSASTLSLALLLALEPAAGGGGTVSGSGASTAPAATSSGSGTVRVSGSAASTAPAGSSGGSGGVVASGSAASSAQPGTAAGSGSVVVSGSGASTAPAAVSSGTGTIGATPVTGSGASVAPAGVAAGSGSVVVAGAGQSAAGSPSTAGAGAAVVSGSASNTALPGSSSGTGSAVVSGAGTSVAAFAVTAGTGTVSSVPPLTPATVRVGQAPRAVWSVAEVESVWSSGRAPRAVWRCGA
ncbi:hypothetical protein [Actinophytocola sp. NPDC049390]|uniref:hypothetical protein n=1 Tax=Actinophytocola sp. NPDC049390 TaxID=3363894 RepID=UPI0037B582C1